MPRRHFRTGKFWALTNRAVWLLAGLGIPGPVLLGASQAPLAAAAAPLPGGPSQVTASPTAQTADPAEQVPSADVRAASVSPAPTQTASQEPPPLRLPGALTVPEPDPGNPRATPGSAQSFDLVAYDSTPAGLAAAIEARRHGLSALVLSPFKHLGGLTTSGLGATDVGRPEAIGGIAREFYLRLAAHYAGPGVRWDQADLQPAFRFEPRVAEALLEDWLAEAGVEVWREVELLGLELTRAVLLGTETRGSRITRILLKDGRSVTPRFVIDASYEGDLLPLCELPFRVGREAVYEYDEALNGVQFSRAVYHQFGAAIDPYVIPGDPSSGLLPELEASEILPDGAPDDRLQGFCFRLCLTKRAENRLPFTQPAGYDPDRYELLLRWFDAGADWLPLHAVELPNGKTDTNNNGPVSSDWIGGNRGWLNATRAEREQIATQHRAWQEGLLWTLAQHPRVPEPVKEAAQAFGHAADEFVDNDHWPYRLYVREGRRLLGDLVMTEQHCRGNLLAPEPIALAAYTMDSHHVRRQVSEGRVWNEGDVQVGGFPPYPIGYRALLPPHGTLNNLAVPVCLSASHIAYGSIRMEPVFFALGHAAGAAVSLASTGDLDLHAVPYAALRELLLAERQALEFTPEPAGWAAAGQDLGSLAAEQLGPWHLDDRAARFVGPWAESRAATTYLGPGYRHDAGAGGGRRAEWRLALPVGRFALELGFPPASNRASRTLVQVQSPLELRSLVIDQTSPGPGKGSYAWAALGEFELSEPTELVVQVLDQGADGIVVVDALRARLLPESQPPEHAAQAAGPGEPSATDLGASPP